MFRPSIIGGVCLLVGCSNTNEAKVHAPVAASSSMPSGGGDGYSLHVKGMGCPLCATNVKKAIERTPGVAAANIDLGSGLVKVSAKADSTPTESDLRQAVTNAGFQLDRIEKQ